MDSHQNMILEMLIRLQAANLELNSLIISSYGNKEAINRKERIMKELEKWLQTIQNFDGTTPEVRLLSSVLTKRIKNIANIETDSAMSSSEIKKSQDDKVNDLTSKEQSNIVSEVKSKSPVEDIQKTEEIFQSDTKDDIKNIEKIEISPESKTLGLLTRISEVGTATNTGTTPSVSKEKFTRLLSPNDHWNYMDQTIQTKKKYTNMMHMAIPNYLFAVIEEIHRYSSPDPEILKTSIEKPFRMLDELLVCFLRKAPAAGILRRFRTTRRMQHIDIDDDVAISVEDKNHIRTIVQRYFLTLKRYLEADTQPNPKHMYEELQDRISQFNLGSIEVESRLMIQLKNVILENLGEANPDEESTKSNYEKIVDLTSIRILFEIADHWLGESRIQQLLCEMKD